MKVDPASFPSKCPQFANSPGYFPTKMTNGAIDASENILLDAMPMRRFR
jgi:hypothetical protein